MKVQLFHLSQIFIHWTNSFSSNFGSCICPKCNSNLPWFLKPCMVYI